MAPLKTAPSLIGVCTACARQRLHPPRTFSTLRALQFEGESRLPRVANPSFWSSLIPKFLRRPQDSVEAAERARSKASRPKTRNEYAVFIFLGLLVGSNAIQIIGLRNDLLNFSRKTDAKLALLREVVQRVKNGEDVDVKKLLGTGDPEREEEWEEVMKELEETDMLVEGRKKRDAKRAKVAERKRLNEELKATEGDAAPARVNDAVENTGDSKPKFMM